MTKAEQIKARSAAALAENAKIDTSHTEEITGADIAIGDYLLRVGGTDFATPVRIGRVQDLGAMGRMVFSTHGWFSTRPLTARDSVTRVVVA